MGRLGEFIKDSNEFRQLENALKKTKEQSALEKKSFYKKMFVVKKNDDENGDGEGNLNEGEEDENAVMEKWLGSQNKGVMNRFFEKIKKLFRDCFRKCKNLKSDGKVKMIELYNYLLNKFKIS